MADPLSVTASVVGITTAALQSVQFLAKTIDTIKDVPDTIKSIRADPSGSRACSSSLEQSATRGCLANRSK